MLAGLAGAVSGAIGEALAGVLGIAKMAGFIKYATVGLSGGIEATVENTILGKETTFGDFLSSAIISGVSYGILDNVFRGAKRLFGSTAKETLEETGERTAKNIVETGQDFIEDATQYSARADPNSYYTYEELSSRIREAALSGKGKGLEAHHLLEKQYASKFQVRAFRSRRHRRHSFP